MRALFFSTLALASLALAPGAKAQDMLSATIQSNIDYTTNQRMIDDTRRHDRDVYLRARRPNGSSSVDNSAALTQNAVMSVLQPEYQRRLASFGKAPADAWLVNVSRVVGRQVGSLRPEYLDRVRLQGRPRADDWYVAQARSIGRRLVPLQ